MYFGCSHLSVLSSVVVKLNVRVFHTWNIGGGCERAFDDSKRSVYCLSNTVT